MKLLLYLFAIIPFLISCQFLKPDYLTEITPHELSQRLAEQDIFLVDVHIPEQVHLKGTDLFVPYNNIAENLHRFPVDKSTPIFLYCESGPMGNAAARVLYANGYKNLFNLKGGTHAWQEADLDYP